MLKENVILASGLMSDLILRWRDDPAGTYQTGVYGMSALRTSGLSAVVCNRSLPRLPGAYSGSPIVAHLWKRLFTRSLSSVRFSRVRITPSSGSPSYAFPISTKTPPTRKHSGSFSMPVCAAIPKSMWFRPFMQSMPAR